MTTACLRFRSLQLPWLAAFLAALLALPGRGPGAEAREARPAAVSAQAKALAEANNRLAWELHAAAGGVERNLFLSPYSIASALQMAREGARGETAAEMDRVLHVGDLEDLGAAYAALRGSLRPPRVHDHGSRERRTVPAYEMAIANRLWGQAGLDFEEPFVSALGKRYGAPLQRVDFRQTERARKLINDWVEKHTRGRIRDIIPPGLPTPRTSLALANAIWFKARWQETFRDRATQDGTWHGIGGTEKEVPLMRQVHRHRYAEVDGVRLLEMAYRGDATSMVVMLPRTTEELAALEARLASGACKPWFEKLAPRRVDVTLPRFGFTTPTRLDDILKGLGMKQAFDARRADFSGMTTEEKLFIGAALHKAFIEVDEKGTEAAAATVVLMDKGSAAPERPVAFRADRPFVFCIRHRATGSLLFTGRLVDPAAE